MEKYGSEQTHGREAKRAKILVCIVLHSLSNIFSSLFGNLDEFECEKQEIK